MDKTRFIHELENWEIPIFLRPRRFGKSLWCSILECYYDVNRRDRFDELFAGTDIGRNPTPGRNSCLVMRFDFSVVTVCNSMAELEKNFRRAGLSCLRDFISSYSIEMDFNPDESLSETVG